jgi:hypothetical protein
MMFKLYFEFKIQILNLSGIPVGILSPLEKFFHSGTKILLGIQVSISSRQWDP